MVGSQTTYTINGILKKIKEDNRLQVFDLECHIQGISGSIYIDKSYLPLFDELILKKQKELV